MLLRSHGERLGEDGRSRLDVVLRLTWRMDDLIESLLHCSRIGRVDLAVEEVDLDAVLDEVAGTLRPRLETTETELRRPRRLPVLRCDCVRMREVLADLLGNAIKYNDKLMGSRWVEVSWQDGIAGGSPVFHVRDNGIGIPAAHHERIFEIFCRLHGRGECGEGSGAGLTIVRRTVERHGARVWVKSTPGEGATFRFTLAPGAGPGGG